MLVEDSAAFVERLEVPAEGSGKQHRRLKRAELQLLSAKWEVHLAESAVLELERRIGDAKPDEVAVVTARVDRLEARFRAGRASRQSYVAFRLHSAGCHVDCSEDRF